jgi:hypothetical protein
MTDLRTVGVGIRIEVLESKESAANSVLDAGDEKGVVADQPGQRTAAIKWI